MTSARAIVLGMILVVVTAALLKAREDDVPRVNDAHDQVLPAVMGRESEAPRAIEAAKPVAAKASPAAAAAAPEPSAAAIVETSAPATETATAVTITGCLESDEGTFRLTDASGTDAPTARSWKSGFLKKRAAHVELADGVGTLNLRNYVGRRVAATGTLIEREMRARSVRPVGACD